MCEEMKTLVSRLAEYLRTREQHLRCFNIQGYESQVEGWFKGELLYFLDREKREGRLPDRKRENVVYFDDDPMNAKKGTKCLVDVVLQFDKTESSRVSWVELKHWIGCQKNTPYNPSSYFCQYNKSDIKKLSKIPKSGDKFMLVLYTPKPNPKKWNDGVNNFNKKFSKNLQCSLKPLTEPDDYPDYFFLGLLRVSKKT